MGINKPAPYFYRTRAVWISLKRDQDRKEDLSQKLRPTSAAMTARRPDEKLPVLFRPERVRTPNGPVAMVLAPRLPYDRTLAASIIRDEAKGGAMVAIRAELGT
jgi:hypothetical protein